MSKELEALERIKRSPGVYFEFNCRHGYLEDLDIIETALKNYENSQRIETEVEKYYYKTLVDNENKKKLKALEIIKEKRVEIGKLLFYLKTNACDDSVLSWYNEYSVEFDDRTLTQEEFDLLKEVLL